MISGLSRRDERVATVAVLMAGFAFYEFVAKRKPTRTPAISLERKLASISSEVPGHWTVLNGWFIEGSEPGRGQYRGIVLELDPAQGTSTHAAVFASTVKGHKSGWSLASSRDSAMLQLQMFANGEVP